MAPSDSEYKNSFVYEMQKHYKAIEADGGFEEKETNDIRITPLERLEALKHLCESNISCEPNLKDCIIHITEVAKSLIEAEQMAVEITDYIEESTDQDWFLWKRAMDFVDSMIIKKPIIE